MWSVQCFYLAKIRDYLWTFMRAVINLEQLNSRKFCIVRIEIHCSRQNL
jgi:hypothetical protein